MLADIGHGRVARQRYIGGAHVALVAAVAAVDPQQLVT